MGSEPPSSPAPSSLTLLQLVEATGDSESDSPAGDGGWPVDADEGDAESCCGGDDGGAGSLPAEVLSWDRWMRECAGYHYQQLVAGDGASSATEDAAARADAESDRLFWEACIAHGF
ncbi:uncharacterized protein LOC121053324 [Oryza brachyantha]|uniref:uncharacterized protein LOC121053324 n=1 Tax=Oryza brachyantha TaxID=4533 RepID=UPI001AD95B59|nr:uncharacterized protein LOC121053324 [Oryza brachyantha]